MAIKKTHAQKLEEWLSDHPLQALVIAHAAVRGLLIRDGRIIQGNEEYDSAADYIAHIEQHIDFVGMTPLIRELQADGRKKGNKR